MQILLIEDDVKLISLLSQNLKEEGFEVTAATSSQQLMNLMKLENSFDAIILDRMLPSVDTRDYIEQIKTKWSQTPVLVLSAISTPNEKVDLLNRGVDDYMGKPFSTDELIARIKVLIRRFQQAFNNFIQVGNLTIDTVSRSISANGKSDVLPAKEFLLLKALSQDQKRVWSKSELLDYVWGQAGSEQTNVVESTMANLRKKINELNANVKIRNMRNAGYWIEG